MLMLFFFLAKLLLFNIFLAMIASVRAPLMLNENYIQRGAKWFLKNNFERIKRAN